MSVQRGGLPVPPTLRAAEHQNDGKPHVLIACTGSVATIKLPLILETLAQHDVLIRVVITDSAMQFLQGQSAEQPALSSLLLIPRVEAIYTDQDEWNIPWTRGADILHIELRRWADIMLIAPLSANSLAKMAMGISDGLVLSAIRAWDTTGILDPPRPGLTPLLRHEGKKPILVAPAMNVAMWAHPITRKHMAILENEWGLTAPGGWIHVLRPMEKELACGDIGTGAMMDWRDVVSVLGHYLDIADIHTASNAST